MTRFTLFFSLAFLAIFFCGGLKVHGATVPTINLEFSGKTEVVPSATVETWIAIDTKPVLDLSYDSEIENTAYCPFGDFYCDVTLPRAKRSHIRNELVTTINEQAIRAFVADLALRSNSDPVDAVFSGDENGKIIVAKKEIPGYRLDEEMATQVISDSLSNNNLSPLVVVLPETEVPAMIKASDIEKLGIKELIGSGTSNFKGSPKNRVYNINRALKQFQSVIIAPGAEFSFVEHLGEVDGENGYLPELVIRNNKTEPEFGGGICQVSSTVFRAAIYSGLKITERRNHSYAVQYYKPYGMDATIYIPKPDFKFQNNTKHSIMMQSVIEGDNLTFRFFGTKDGRETTVDGPHILERNPDGSMKTTFTQIVKDRSGQEFIRDEFKSNYKSPALFPHPGEEQKLTEKPKDWSNSQWKEYKKLNP